MSVLMAAAAQLLPVDHVALPSRQVRLADVARVVGASSALRMRVVAELAPTQQRVTLSRAALVSLIRRAAPSLDVAQAAAGTMELSAPLPVREQVGCRAAARDIAAGQSIALTETVSTPCRPREGTTGLVLAEHGDAVAREPITAGAYLGRLALPATPPIRRGAQMTLVSAIGPVTIQRLVTTLQPSRPGSRVFVRDADGNVFASRLGSGDER